MTPRLSAADFLQGPNGHIDPALRAKSAADRSGARAYRGIVDGAAKRSSQVMGRKGASRNWSRGNT